MPQREITEIPQSIQRALNAAASDAEVQRGTHTARVPTYVTTVESLNLSNQAEKKGINSKSHIIRCWVNPTEISWTVPQRGALQKVRGGTIRYTWRNRVRRIFFDEMKVSITFTSGNILPQQKNDELWTDETANAWGTDPSESIRAGETTGTPLVPPGLDNLYLFMALLDEDPMTSQGTENFHLVFHNSPVFPAIMLKGWFDPAGLSFSESAESGWDVKWTIPMEVIQTYPRINNVNELRSIYGISAVG